MTFVINSSKQGREQCNINKWHFVMINHTLLTCVYHFNLSFPKNNSSIVLFKMFSRWFFANKKLIITLRTWKFGDVTYNVMT